MWIDQLDTKQANSKYYNPYTFDPQTLDYQEDVRLAVRDELPDEIDSSDMAEYMYANLFMTELTWPSLFFGTWAAFEPDVRILSKMMVNRILIIAHHPLSLGKGSSISHVQRWACLEKISNWWREMHCLQIMRGYLPRFCYRYWIWAQTRWFQKNYQVWYWYD